MSATGGEGAGQRLAIGTNHLGWLCRQFFATVPEAAPVLRSDERTVRRAIEAGQIPSVKIGNKTLIPVRALLALAGIDLDESPPETGGGGLHAVG